MAVLDFLRWQNRSFLDIVRADRERKDAAALRRRYYQDRQIEDLLRLIGRSWAAESVKDFRPFFINIVRKIVNKRAMVYAAAPWREFKGLDQDAGDALYRAMGANVILKKANRLTKLHKTTLLQVRWNEAREVPTLAVVTPNIADAVYDDPEDPERLIVTHPGTREQDTTYSDWTAETWVRRDWRGQAIPAQGNPDGINPYGILPFVPLFDSAPDDEFFVRGGDDLIEAQRAINVALTNLWRAIEWNSHGQAWMSGEGVNKDDPFDRTPFGPQTVLRLPAGGEFGFAAPNTPVEEVLKAIEFLVKQTAVANDLAANVFELDPKAESGAAKHAESRDLIEARADDIDLWRVYETQIFEVVKRVVNTHRPGTIPEGASVSVDFGELDEGTEEGARLDVYQRRIDMGIWSAVDALMADNPDIRSRQDALRIIQERREEAATLGTAFANPRYEATP